MSALAEIGVIQQQDELYGPLGESTYKYNARVLLKEAVQDGAIDRTSREAMWQRYGVLDAALTARFQEVEAESLSVVEVLEEEIWKIRATMGTVYTNTDGVMSWAEYRSKNKKGELAGKSPDLALDDHHLEVEKYGARLIQDLITSAESKGIPLPIEKQKLLLLSVGMRFHDILKWISKYGSKDTIMADHEEQLRALVSKHFVGKGVLLPNGETITLTQDYVTFLAEALGNHENIFEEQEWSKERAQENDQGRAISLLFLIDTMTGAIVVEQTPTGAVARIDTAQLSRFTDLAERHLRLFIQDEDAQGSFRRAKAYRPEWILQSTLDFLEILASWEKAYGVTVRTEEVEKIFSACIEIFEKARLALAPYQELDSKAEKRTQVDVAIRVLRERQRSLALAEDIQAFASQNSIFFDVTTQLMRDRGTLCEIAVATGKAYALRSGREALESVLSDEEQRIIVLGPEYWRPLTATSDRTVESFARNSVGYANLLRLLALFERTGDDVAHSLTFKQRLEMFAGPVEDISDEVLQIGARGSHSSWYLTTLALGRETTAAVLPFDRRSELIVSSDWIQIRSAARFVLEELQRSNVQVEFATLCELYRSRDFMVRCARACHDMYAQTQREYFASTGGKPPEWLAQPLFTEDEQQALIADKVHGLDTTNPVNRARLKYIDNTASFVTLQEEIANIAKLRGRAAIDVLDDIIANRLPERDKALLTSSQKAQYLIIQVLKGRFSDTTRPVDVSSLLPVAGNTHQVEDWNQLREAAIIMRSQIADAVLESEPTDYRIERTLGRPTRVIDSAAGESELLQTLEGMGIRRPDMIIMFSGGAVFMQGGVDLEQLKAELTQQLSSLLGAGKRVLVVTGGTDSGFMKIAGEVCAQVHQANQQSGGQLQVLGVSPEELITFDAASATDSGPYAAATGHTHHLLVNKTVRGVTGRIIDLPEHFGDETETIRNVLNIIGRADAQKLAIVGNGGVGTALEIRALIDIGYPILLVKDSLRLATLVGISLECDTYATYESRVSDLLTSHDNEPEALTKQKQRTKREIDNIFSILRPDDEGVQSTVGENGEQRVAVSNANFQKLKALLARTKHLRYAAVEEIAATMQQ